MTETTCVVIHNGGRTTIAGFSDQDLPQVVCPSSYAKGKDGEVVFGYLEMLQNPGEVFTIMDSRGCPYNWEALEQQWRWIYEQVLEISPEELPLVITVPPDLSAGTRSKYLELALEKLKVPVFQMVVEPLAISLSLGRNTSLVVDIGASKITVTPIIDGSVVKPAVLRSKFAGDFLDYQVAENLKNSLPIEPAGEDSKVPESFKYWESSRTWIHDFKATMLQVSPSKIQELEGMQDTMAFSHNPLDNKKYFLYKKGNKTLTLEQRECYKLAEMLFQPQLASDQFAAKEGLAELVVKAVKKAGAAVTTSNSGPAGGGGPSGSSSMGIGATSTTTPEQIHAALLTNIVITGSTSLVPGVEQRIVNELSYQFPQYKLSSFANPMVLDRKLQSWQGGVTMSNLPSWELGNWITRQEYDANGINSEKL